MIHFSAYTAAYQTIAVPAVFLPQQKTARSRLCENVASDGYARQKQAKKRSLRAVNEHFEPVFNAA
jgi:hypothetical protein